MIETSFKKSLGDSEAGTNQLIRKQYVEENKEKNYQTDQKGQLKWGLIYTYYKSGLFAKFLSKVSENGRHGTSMRKAFEELQITIDDFSPTTQEL